MVDKEIEEAKHLGQVFDKNMSRVFHVMSNFALNMVHYEAIVHPLMDAAREGSLLDRIFQETERGAIFSLDFEDYQQLQSGGDEGGERKIEHDSNFNFANDLEVFKAFLERDFLDAICIDLPMNLRKFFSHALNEIHRRQFTMDSGDITIPPELQICEPLLEFYLQGVLIPVLENLTAYAGPKTGLRKSAEKAKETDLQRNVSQVCKFMKALMNPNAKMHKVFQVTKKSIRPRLLKFIQQQASVEDDTTTQLTIDVFASQYDIEKHSVFLKTDDLLGLSNLLIEHENKLRLTENDEVHL